MLKTSAGTEILTVNSSSSYTLSHQWNLPIIIASKSFDKHCYFLHLEQSEKGNVIA